VHVQGVVFN